MVVAARASGKAEVWDGIKGDCMFSPLAEFLHFVLNLNTYTLFQVYLIPMAIHSKPLSAASCDVAPVDRNGASIVPKTCKAGVVQEYGPNFRLAVEEVNVPEPGKSS